MDADPALAPFPGTTRDLDAEVRLQTIACVAWTAERQLRELGGDFSMAEWHRAPLPLVNAAIEDCRAIAEGRAKPSPAMDANAALRAAIVGVLAPLLLEG